MHGAMSGPEGGRNSSATTRRRGFSMVEVVTALAIIAVLVGVITPVVTRRIRYAQATALAETFDALRVGIRTFKEHTTEYPGLLSQLQGRPDNVVVSATRACGGTMSAAVRAAWQGPYVARNPANPNLGVGTGEWRINDALVRVGPGAATDTARLFMNIPNVPVADLNRINEVIDGPAGAVAPQSAGMDTAGVVTWGAIVSGSATLSYGIMIRGC